PGGKRPMTGRTQNGVDGRTTTRIEAAGPWTEHIHAMDQALTERNATTAVRAWRNAYAAALATPGWRGLVEVAAGSLRIGAIPGFGKASEARARETYWLALFRARQQGSLNGVLDAAEAFGALGASREHVPGLEHALRRWVEDVALRRRIAEREDDHGGPLLKLQRPQRLPRRRAADRDFLDARRARRPEHRVEEVHDVRTHHRGGETQAADGGHGDDRGGARLEELRARVVRDRA